MTRRTAPLLAALPLALGAAALGAVVASAGSGGGQAAEAKTLRFDASRLFVETNATDGDAGLQLDLDGEDWDRVRITDPRGRALVDFTTLGSLTGYGLTGVVFESSEPPFSEHSLAKFRARFPQLAREASGNRTITEVPFTTAAA